MIWHEYKAYALSWEIITKGWRHDSTRCFMLIKQLTEGQLLTYSNAVNSGDIKPNELQFCSPLIIDLKFSLILACTWAANLFLILISPLTWVSTVRWLTWWYTVEWAIISESVGCIYYISLGGPWESHNKYEAIIITYTSQLLQITKGNVLWNGTPFSHLKPIKFHVAWQHIR